MPKKLKVQKEVDTTDVERIIEFLKMNGAGSVVKRTKVAGPSCDFLQPGTCRNDDSSGRGPDERILFGVRGEVGYPIESLARYMAKRGFKIEQREQVAINE